MYIKINKFKWWLNLSCCLFTVHGKLISCGYGVIFISANRRNFYFFVCISFTLKALLASNMVNVENVRLLWKLRLEKTATHTHTLNCFKFGLVFEHDENTQIQTY